MFRAIKGQDKTIDILSRAVREDKVAQSYLFYGPDGVGKFTTALYFGMAINCVASLEKRPCGVCASCKKFLSFTHPDFIYIFPTPNLEMSLEGEIKSEKYLQEYKAFIAQKAEHPWKQFFFSSNTEIRIGTIRMLQHRINLSPNEGNRKIYIIENADQMNVKTANAFLKTLEEPPNDTVIILTTTRPNALLPTILSRCQKLAFGALPRNIIEEELTAKRSLSVIEAKTYARIANGSLEKALQLSDSGSTIARKEALRFLTMILEKDDFAAIDFATHYKSSKTQSQLIDIIAYLIVWVSDLSNLQNLPDDIVNLDCTDMLESFYQRNPQVNDYGLKLLSFLEKMIKKIEGHVNPQLIVTEIYFRFCAVFVHHKEN
ncbi:MAG: DNA polymerase III subunit delta' [Candidatus Cloacimonetes bacterium]|nr:DNA polymerase III subunit delta' [Candidatus Cloacimonadota bacterium]